MSVHFSSGLVNGTQSLNYRFSDVNLILFLLNDLHLDQMASVDLQTFTFFHSPQKINARSTIYNYIYID